MSSAVENEDGHPGRRRRFERRVESSTHDGGLVAGGRVESTADGRVPAGGRGGSTADGGVVAGRRVESGTDRGLAAGRRRESSSDGGLAVGGRSESGRDGGLANGEARSPVGRTEGALGGGVDGGGIGDRLDALVARVEGVLERPGPALALAAVVIGVAVGAWLLSRPVDRPPVESAIPMATTPPTAAAVGPGAPPAGGDGPAPGDGGTSADPSEPTELVVHVAGAVRRPGVVTLDPGARIVDAVDAAGGATAEADLHRLNLAAPVTDGLYIRVPIEGEVVSPVGIPSGTGSGPGGEGDDGAGSVVDVNRATDTELERLPGIGPALAAAIVEWRSTNGPFATIEDLLDVPGIGPAKLAGFADQIVL